MIKKISLLITLTLGISFSSHLRAMSFEDLPETAERGIAKKLDLLSLNRLSSTSKKLYRGIHSKNNASIWTRFLSLNQIGLANRMSLHPREFLKQNLENPILFLIENQTGRENVTVSSAFVYLNRYNQSLDYSPFNCQINGTMHIIRESDLPARENTTSFEETHVVLEQLRFKFEGSDNSNTGFLSSNYFRENPNITVCYMKVLSPYRQVRDPQGRVTILSEGRRTSHERRDYILRGIRNVNREFTENLLLERVVKSVKQPASATSGVFVMAVPYSRVTIQSNGFKTAQELKSVVAQDYNIPISDVQEYPSLYDLTPGEKFTQTTEPGWLKN